MFLAGTLAWAARRAWRLGRREDRPLVVAVSSAILAWYVQNLFGFPVAATASLFVVLAAMLSRLAWPSVPVEPVGESSKSNARTWASALAATSILAVGLTLAYGLVARPYLAGCCCHQGEELQQVDPEQALVWHERAVRLHSGRDVLWIKLTACTLAAAERTRIPSRRQQLLLRAHDAVENACRLVPAKGENHGNRALVLFRMAREGMGRAQDALAGYDTALALDPENTDYLEEAAAVAVNLGLSERAREYIARGLRIDPELGMLHATQAALELAKGRYREAEKRLDVALTGHWHDMKRYCRAAALLCVTYLDTGRSEQALLLADCLLTQDDSLQLHFLRARALEKLGRRPDAEWEYRRVVELRPDHAMARAGLARLEAKNGRSRQGLPAGSAD
jgi:hypothetical protein